MMANPALRRVFLQLAGLIEAERERWPLFVPVVLGLGIATWFLLPVPALWLGAVLLAGAVACGGAMMVRTRPGRLLLWAGLLFVLGLGGAWFRATQVAAPVLTGPIRAAWCDAVIIEDRIARHGARRLLVRPTRISGLDGSDLPHRMRLTWRGATGARLAPGTMINARMRLAPPPAPVTPGGYDMARAAWFQRIGATGVVLGTLDIVAGPDDEQDWIARLRLAVGARIDSYLKGQTAALARALIIGDRGALTDATNTAFRDAGISHLLSISGLHLSLVAGSMMLLVRRGLALVPALALRVPAKAIGAVAAGLIAVAYTLITGSEIPTVRACIAALIVLTAILIGREPLSLRLVATGATLILLARPEALLDVSFQLSFAAITTLVWAYGSLPMLRPPGGIGWPARVGWMVLDVVVTSILIELAVLPIVLYHFNRLAWAGVLANAVAIPLTSFLVMPAALGAVLLIPIGLDGPVFRLLGWTLDHLLAFTGWAAALPGTPWLSPGLPLGAVLLLVMAGLVFVLLRGPLRWSALALSGAGLALGLMTQPPDLWISDKGSLLAVRLPDGSLGFSDLRPARFARASWLEERGLSEPVRLMDAPQGVSLEPGCGPAACGFLLAGRGRRIGWVNGALDPKVAAAWCVQHDVLVLRQPLAGCRARLLTVTPSVLARSGAITLRFGRTGGALTMATARRAGDRHPWIRE